MPNKKHAPAQRPAPGPKGNDQQALEELKRAIDRAVVTLEGAINIAAVVLQRRLDERFGQIKELLEKLHQ